MLNLVATTLFLIAVGYLYAIFGTLNMADIAREGARRTSAGAADDRWRRSSSSPSRMKAAAFPVNFWLPASYHTPRVDGVGAVRRPAHQGRRLCAAAGAGAC